MYADLHFHSTCSDGKHSVDWVSALLKNRSEQGLGLAILTDHDGVDGFDQFSEKTASLWPSIRACELSCMYQLSPEKDQELHLLVYGIAADDFYLNQIFEKFRSSRKDRFLGICEKLAAAGYPVDAESIVNEHPGRLGRPHVADALVRAGYVETRKQAFDKFLRAGSPYQVPKWRLDIADALKHCREQGYRTSIAHPGIYSLGMDELKALKGMGLDAVEVFHPRHTPAQHKLYKSLAQSLGLDVSGGSDFHDASSDETNGEPSLGQSLYPLEMAEKFLEDIL